MNGETIIKFENVSKAYAEKKVLNSFLLDIPRGEFLTVIGSSGCGKTTMLKLINGLLLPDSGSVTVDGANTANTD